MDTPAEVLAEMQKQIDWRGPTGRSMGHVVITREQATVLLNSLKAKSRFQLVSRPDERRNYRRGNQCQSLRSG
jgi:hypothetical protein